MRTTLSGTRLFSFPLSLHRLIVPAIMLACLATPVAFGLYAKDKDKEEKKEKEEKKDKAAREQKEKDKEKEKEKGKGKEKEREKEKEAEKPVVATKVDDTTRAAAPVVTLADIKLALAPALEAGRSSRDTIRKLPGYTCTFIKQEQLSKKGPLVKQTMIMKFRREPFSVYLKSVSPNAGREVIYVEGRNDGKLKVHEASGFVSLLGTISLAPTSNDALKENKYPITMIGMEKMLDGFLLEWDESHKHLDTKVTVNTQAKLGLVDCTLCEVIHPQQREGFRSHKGRVYIDKKTNLPIRAEQFGFPTKSSEEPALIEEYSYIDIKTDVPLTDVDFDVANDKYGFK